MLITPFGGIHLYVNEQEINYKAIKLDNIFPAVKGRYLIQYNYKTAFGKQKITCSITSTNEKRNIESGEQLEAISFYKDDIKLTIGTEGDFYDESSANLTSDYDYNGHYLSNGIQLQTTHTTEDKMFFFVVCWMQPFTETTEHLTWLGADPNKLK